MSKITKNKRGGFRSEAGRKSGWNHSPTKLVRLPVDLIPKILQLAHLIDDDPRSFDGYGAFDFRQLKNENKSLSQQMQVLRDKLAVFEGSTNLSDIIRVPELKLQSDPKFDTQFDDIFDQQDEDRYDGYFSEP